MPESDFSSLPHLIVKERVRSESYTHPGGGGGGPPPLPSRNRSVQASKLLSALNQIEQHGETLKAQRAAAGAAGEFNLVIEFEGEPGSPLKAESLDSPSNGVQLLNVRTVLIQRPDGTEIQKEFATVRIAPGQLQYLASKVETYRDQDTPKGDPKNRELVDPIAEIRWATLEAFWNEDVPIPTGDSVVSWEAWIHTGLSGDERERVLIAFRSEAARIGIEIGPRLIALPETTVVFLRASAIQLASSIDLLNCLAELRQPAVSTAFFTEMPGFEQVEWVNEAVRRLEPPSPFASAVCLLDSGVNDQHPLLRPIIPADGLHAYDPAWGTHDAYPGRGHGTPMAGIAGYNDLKPALSGSGPLRAAIWIESVKTWNSTGEIGAQPELWGAVTQESIARIEQAAPGRRRVFSLQITSALTAVRGRPTSWSAEIDQLASGAGEDPKTPRLIAISAGNAYLNRADQYPAANQISQVHDPAQAWNAVVVGGYTQKIRVDDPDSPDLEAVAPSGGLAPASTTSLIWHDPWPLKPDIVMEAGNLVKGPDGTVLDHHDSLDLLSTSADFRNRPLTATGETSAAAVQGARLLAIVQQSYPSLWAETVRALVIHSARWTPSMLDQRNLGQHSKGEMAAIVRQFGFGVPDEREALSSARNVLTLVAEDVIQPYIEEDGAVATNELRFHTLPWPKTELQQLGEAVVEMRVTLSYFIEPNPGPRLPNDRYRYASCGLRFDLRRPTESEREFQARVNREARSPGPVTNAASDSSNWVLGSDWRHRGSVHSDIWLGTAVELAEKNHIAVIPVGGWWRERKRLRRANSQLRYALVVTIRTPPNEVDIYTPVATEIGIPVVVPNR